MEVDINELKKPISGCLYCVKKNTVKRRGAERFIQPPNQGWQLKSTARQEVNIFPGEIIMVISETEERQVPYPGHRGPATNYWVVSLLHKEKLWEKLWFTPVKWHIMFEEIKTEHENR